MIKTTVFVSLVFIFYGRLSWSQTYSNDINCEYDCFMKQNLNSDRLKREDCEELCANAKGLKPFKLNYIKHIPGVPSVFRKKHLSNKKKILRVHKLIVK